MTDILSTRINNDLKELSNLTRKAKEPLESLGLPSRVITKVRIVLEEVISNIIEYGYNDTEIHQIDVRLALEGEEFVIICVDDGLHFNPETAPKPDLSSPILERDAGGLGIHLVREMMDSVTYQRKRNKNVLELRVKAMEE